MKILVIGLASVFTEGMNYQDNLLANQFRCDGHDVVIVSDCNKYQNGVIIETNEEDKILENGIRLIRLKYKNIFGKSFSSKIRAVNGLYKIIESEEPDIIFQHSPQGYEILTVAKYKQMYPKVKVFVDSHADFNNSATNFLSKTMLHKFFYKRLIFRALPYIDMMLYVSLESYEFLRDIYSVPDYKMEYFPLGGLIFSEDERNFRRSKIRDDLDIREDDILLVHTGKMNKEKRTEEVIQAFNEFTEDNINNNLYLVLIGSINEEVYENINELISKNSKIKYLGWKDGDSVIDYLCACDLYIQPGSQSATMQNALCCGSALALYPHKSHKNLLDDTVFYIENINDMLGLYKNIFYNPQIITEKRKESFKIALELLDYRKLANRIYS